MNFSLQQLLLRSFLFWKTRYTYIFLFVKRRSLASSIKMPWNPPRPKFRIQLCIIKIWICSTRYLGPLLIVWTLHVFSFIRCSYI